MNTRNASILAAVLGLGAFLALGNSSPTQEPRAEQEGVEVLARGPVHEAFAEPTEPRPEASPVVRKRPPEPIEELPPEQRPAGDDVEWIPGYWAYDDDQDDFLWVSGFWREAPPGRTWVPGHWQEVDGGWQWSSGFWATDDVEEIRYVPPPPPPVEAGPSVPAPRHNMNYVPGCWVFRETRFFWRPGFWVEFRPGWVWVPARYVWTPGGCIFVEGYWDYPLHDRGLLFAPVRITPTVLVQRRFTYVPRYVVRHDFLIGALFVRAQTRSYYFGDYFDERYDRRGFVPWVDFRVGRDVHDQNFSYYRHRFDGDDWGRNLRELYEARRRGDVPRPPQTLVQQTKVVNNITVNKTENVTVTKNINITNIQNVQVLAPITQVNNTKVTALASLAGKDPNRAPRPADRDAAEVQRTIQLTAVAKEEQAQKAKRIEQVRQVEQQRRQAVAKLLSAGPPAKPTDAPKAVKLELPKAPAKPPAAAAPPARPGVTTPPTAPAKKAAPPPPPAVPKPEEKAIPKHDPPKPAAPPRPAQEKKDAPAPAPPAKDKTPPKKDDKPPATPPPAPKKDAAPPATPKKDAPDKSPPMPKKDQDKKPDDKKGEKPDKPKTDKPPQ